MTSPLAPPIEPQARRTVFLDGRRLHEVIRAWPEPSCWRLTPSEGWVERRPWIHTRFADDPWPHRGKDDLPDLRGWEPRVEVLLKDVPDDVRKVLRPLCDKVCWAVLKLVAAAPEVMELAPDNLSLVALIALTAEEAEHPHRVFEQVRAGLAGPRRHLLPLVGLPASKALLRVLAKLDPEALSRPGPDEVVELLLNEEREVVKALRHLQAIRPDLVQVLLAPELRQMCSFALLADPDGPLRWGLHSALADIRSARRENRASEQPARFSSRREVVEFSRTIRQLPRPTWNPTRFRTTFDSPIGELVLIEEPRVLVRPITAAPDMMEHGLLNKLCIPRHDGYPEEAWMGEGALFEVSWTDKGERRRTATAWLIRRSGGWLLSELRGTSNRPVPVWLRDRVANWSWEMEQVEDHEEPVEPLRVPEPDPQLLLPLGWSPSPLEGPTVHRTSSAKRPLMEYGDWCDTEGWLFQWEWL